MRRFHSYVINAEHQFIDLRNLVSHHDSGSYLDEVYFQDFRHKRKTPRSSQVAFNYSGLIAFGYELNIERAINIERAGDSFSDLSDLAHCFNVGALGWENKGCVPRMHACVLNMLGNG